MKLLYCINQIQMFTRNLHEQIIFNKGWIINGEIGTNIVNEAQNWIKKNQEDHSCQHFWSANSQNVPLEVGFWGFYRMWLNFVPHFLFKICPQAGLVSFVLVLDSSSFFFSTFKFQVVFHRFINQLIINKIISVMWRTNVKFQCLKRRNVLSSQVLKRKKRYCL